MCVSLTEMRFGGTILITVLAVCGHAEREPGPLAISARPANNRKSNWPQEPIVPVGGTRYLLELESSADLQNWQSAGKCIVARTAISSTSRPTLPPASSQTPSSNHGLGNEVSGDELFGSNVSWKTNWTGRLPDA